MEELMGPEFPEFPELGKEDTYYGKIAHKAEKKGDAWLADRIYSGVPAGTFGKEQEIEIGHYSGESNVVYWLTKRGYEPTKELVAAVLGAAKSGDHVLSDGEITAVIERARGSTSAAATGG